jgi:hypothetical protein
MAYGTHYLLILFFHSSNAVGVITCVYLETLERIHEICGPHDGFNRLNVKRSFQAMGMCLNHTI